MNYTVTLTPLEPFFFGGERTFGRLGDEQNGSYLAHSEYFPSQTALLGMLRKELMIQAGLLTRKIRGEWVDKADKAEAAKLVGNEKFDFSRSDTQDFGVIEEIGPMHLLDERGNRYLWRADIDSFKIAESNGFFKLDGYKPKDCDLFGTLIRCDDRKQRCSMSDVFQSVETVGIQKHEEEDAFFKRQAFRLKKGWSFAFDLKLRDTKLAPSIVTLGADGGRFRLGLKEDLAPIEEILDLPEGWTLLLGDAKIDEPIEALCDFAVVRAKSHRMLVNKKGVLKKYATRFQKSPTVRLYGQGTMLYRPKEEALIEALNLPNLKTIGYNQFIQGANA